MDSGQSALPDYDILQLFVRVVLSHLLRMQVVHFEFITESDKDSIKVETISFLQAVVEGFVGSVRVGAHREDQVGED